MEDDSMLRSIRELKMVGCFVDAGAPSLQFEPLTFIYGENCYGKSTLCEILRSLAEARPDYIKNKTTIPNLDNLLQRVQVSLTIPGINRE